KVGNVNTAEIGTERIIVNNNFAHLRYSYGSSVYRLIDFLTPRCEANHNIILSDVFQSSANVVGIRLGHGLGDAYNIANGNIVWNLVQSMVADELPGQGITGDTSVGNNYIRVLNNIFYQGGFDFGENVFAIV